jgi:HAD superfamily hydrolase (TIGR01456 family)
MIRGMKEGTSLPLETGDLIYKFQLIYYGLRLPCNPLRSKNGVIGGEQMSTQQVPIFFSNADFEFSNEFIHNRFAQGAFKRCLKHLYKEKTGLELAYTQYGKPETITYDYASDLFPRDCRTVYAIGDNPESDIVGARAFGWKSVMVRTGVWREGAGRDHGADHVCDDVGEAVDLILEREGVK